MPTPTPAPWKIRAERHRFIHIYSSGGGIAHLDTIDEEGAANARLIAAAPDLLAVALAVLEHACIEMPQALIAAAEMAVAKATGDNT